MALLSDTDLYAELRELIGSPALDQVSSRTLRKYVVSGLEWLADQFKIHVEDTTLTLVASTRFYTLPTDFLQLVNLTWNYDYLEPASLAKWTREQEDWENATAASTLSEYALFGRQLILKPPPNATAVSTAGTLRLRYLSSSPGLDGDNGATGLTEADQRLALYHGAREYCLAHPERDDQPWTRGTAVRLQGYSAFVKERLAAAARRAQAKDRSYSGTIQVGVTRRGAAR